MNVFEYIAEHNTDAAEDLCIQNGGAPTTMDELASMLQRVAEEGGEKGFADVMSLHPDMEILVEKFGASNKGQFSEFDGKHDCNKCRQLQQMLIQTNTGIGANGQESSMAPLTLSQHLKNTNSLLIFGAVSLGVIAICVLIKK